MSRFALFVALIACTALAQDTDTDVCDPLFEFDCGASICISIDEVCDGNFDCPGGFDEADCGDGSLVCTGTYPASDDWCDANCNHSPPNCPPDFCTCATGARPDVDDDDVVVFQDACTGTAPATDEWCTLNCNAVPRYCPRLCSCGGIVSENGAPSAYTCMAIDPRATDSWCESSCHHSSAACPDALCQCTDVDNNIVMPVDEVDDAPSDGQDIEWRSIVGGVDDYWCNINCNHTPPNCPETICEPVNSIQ